MAAGTSKIPTADALVPLIIGSSIFVQLHLVLGLAFGPVARSALDRAKGPAIAVFVLVALAGVVIWLARRGARDGGQAAVEACCPACVALGAIGPRVFDLDDLTPAS